ncbi:hypothetical protein LOK49_LG06G01184 [Camellia lanceoleosa]|uniref:Uncharacterized protein n=1 Tax=Camellia lanceoleosa TaxID=1840588 RepID=A0ACC0HBR1_9ERIC|nr:hypothetical protein LOK49_LG06G01184 [Camellia lanceoleosa]
MIGDEKNELVSYDSQTQQIKHHGVHGCYHSAYVVTYIESLVALEGANGLRKANPISPDTVAEMEASRPRRKRQTRLGNSKVRKVVDQSVQEYLTEYLELHADAALAAKRVRELVRQKSVLRSSSLPGKLADCSATNLKILAVLPMRGKILNMERKDEAAMYKNEEIQNLILGLGLGVKGEDFKKEALRYHKIIILIDADVDDAHI